MHAQLTFTLSSSGRPGRDFCEETACEVRQGSHNWSGKKDMETAGRGEYERAAHPLCLLHLLGGFGPVLHVLLGRGGGGTLEESDKPGIRHQKNNYHVIKVAGRRTPHLTSVPWLGWRRDSKVDVG